MINHKKHLLSFLVLGFFYVLLVATTVSHSDNKEELMSEYDMSIAMGRCVFMQYCQSCHVLPEKNLADNLLKGAFDRFPQPADTFFIKFISDSRSLRDSGDEYAKAIHKEWERNYDHEFQYVFTPKEFAGLLSYMKQHTK